CMLCLLHIGFLIQNNRKLFALSLAEIVNGIHCIPVNLGLERSNLIFRNNKSFIHKQHGDRLKFP
ncbi:MAG: hypothetical protein ACYT04_69620, partial [Nostoc sp.]